MHKILFFSLVIIALSSCRDSEDKLGIHLQNKQFELVYDTLNTISTSIKYADSISLSGATLGLIGDYNDPYFGRTQAALAFQLLPKASAVSLGANPTADSIVLKLTKRSGYYGLDSAAAHTIRVWKVKTAHALDTIDSTQVSIIGLFPYKGDLLAEKTITLNPNDTTPFNIPLDIKPEFATTILNNTDKYTSDSLFKTLLGGLIVEAENKSTNGNIVTVTYSENMLTMTLYYHSAAGQNRTLEFVLKDAAKRYSIFEHQYSSHITDALNGTGNKSLAFLQGMNGVGTKVEINNLDALFSDSLYNVNSAILRCRLAPESDTNAYIPPPSIFIRMYDDSGEEVFTPDYIGSNANTTSPENYNTDISGYNIRLNRALFDILRNRHKTKLVITIYATSQLTNANRAVFAGSEYSDVNLRPTLYVIRSR